MSLNFNCVSPETRAVLWSCVLWASDQLLPQFGKDKDDSTGKTTAYHEAPSRPPSSTRAHSDNQRDSDSDNHSDSGDDSDSDSDVGAAGDAAAGLDDAELGVLNASFTSFTSANSLDSGYEDCDTDAGPFNPNQGSHAKEEEHGGTTNTYTNTKARTRRRLSSVCAVAFRWNISVADAQDLCATFEAAQSQPVHEGKRLHLPAPRHYAALPTLILAA